MRHVVSAFVTLLGLSGWSPAAEPTKIDLRVLYVGATETPRGKAYAQFLQKQFRQAEATERNGFDPKKASAFDVVVLDWSQRERPDTPTSPLGAKETWEKPTVLLGSAGLLLAQAWEIHGTIG